MPAYIPPHLRDRGRGGGAGDPSLWRGGGLPSSQLSWQQPRQRGFSNGSACPDEWCGSSGGRDRGPGDPSLLGGGCDCASAGSFDVYCGDHTLTTGTLSPGSTLLGNIRQYCGGFWHIEATAEVGLSEACLPVAGGGGRPCARKTVVIIARLQRACAEARGWRDIHVARYHNCHRRDGTRAHAESFLVADRGMRALISALAGEAGPRPAARLLLHMTYQPCHHSGGHTPAQIGKSPLSCTTLLLGYLREVLSPAGVALELAVANIYRAHWRAGQYASKYAPAVSNATEGIALLGAAEGVTLRSFCASDWVALAALCDESTQRALSHPSDDSSGGSAGAAAGPGSCADSSGDAGSSGDPAAGDAPLPSEAMRAARETLDGFFGATLRDLQFAAGSVPAAAVPSQEGPSRLGPRLRPPSWFEPPSQCEPCDAVGLADELGSVQLQSLGETGSPPGIFTSTSATSVAEALPPPAVLPSVPAALVVA